MKKSDIRKDLGVQRFIEGFGPATPRRKLEFTEALVNIIWEWCLMADDEAMRHRMGEAAAAIGRKGGLVGGAARMRALAPEQRSEIARKAANTRWNRKAAEGTQGNG